MSEVINRALFHSTAKIAQVKYHNILKESVNELLICSPEAGINEEHYYPYNYKWSEIKVFFRPFENRYDFFSKVASIPLAPVGLVIEAGEDVLLGGYAAFLAVLKLVCCDWQGAMEEVKGSFEFALIAFEKLLTAIVSPLINLFDLIGSGITTFDNSGYFEDSDFDNIGYFDGSDTHAV